MDTCEIKLLENRPESVLVLDDDLGQRNSLTALLKSAGYHAAAVGSGGEALDQLGGGDFSLIVVDWMLGDGVTAADWLARIRISHPACPAIVISGFPADEVRFSAIKAGASRFLRKPFDANHFLRAVSDLVRLDDRELSDVPRSAPEDEESCLAAVRRCLLDRNEPCGVIITPARILWPNMALRRLMGIDSAQRGAIVLDRALAGMDWEMLERQIARAGSAGAGLVQHTQPFRIVEPGDEPPAVSPDYELGLRLLIEGVGRQGSTLTLLTARTLSTTPGKVASCAELHDSLTGLPNRNLLIDRLTHAIRRAQRDRARLALLFVDLDHFKWVNDNLGHPMGDRLLRAAAMRIRACTRDSDTLARYGGDEFVLLMDGVHDEADALFVAEKIVGVLGTAFEIDGHHLHLGGSVGVALYPTHSRTVERLIESADIAMYEAKRTGKSRVCIFSADLKEKVSARTWRKQDLQAAIHRGEFVLHYQPIYAIEKRVLRGFEAYVRWQHPEQGLIGPADFMSHINAFGMASEIGRWTLHTALSDLASWQANAGLKLTVNLSAVQLRDRQLPSVVAAMLDAHGISGELLEFDVQETTLRDSDPVVFGTLEALAALGVRLVVDDFGRGGAALSLLHSLPLVGLKLDHGYLNASERTGASFVAAVAAVARGLGLRLVAERVESQAQFDVLGGVGVDWAQGHYLGEAVPPERVARMLSEQSH